MHQNTHHRRLRDRINMLEAEKCDEVRLWDTGSKDINSASS